MSRYIHETIGQVLRDTVSLMPDKTALVCPESGRIENYETFYEKCRQVAKGFLRLGIQKGDHVAVWATNVPEWAYIQFGMGMIGAVLVTINTNYKSHELRYILWQSDTKALILIDGYRDNDYVACLAEIVPEIANDRQGALNSEDLPYLEHVVTVGNKKEMPGMLRFADVIQMGVDVSDAELEEREKSLDVHDVMNMQYTSGTTGFPKGVMLTHYNIINNARVVGEVMGLTDEDRLLIHVPLFHCFGCVMSTLNCVLFGASMVLMEYFDPLASMKAIHSYACTAINGVPTMFIAMLNHDQFGSFDLRSLRTGIMAGSPCPVEIMNRVREEMHCPEIVIAFGQTESSPVMTMTRRDDPVHLRVSTVGRLLPGIEAKIVDPETRKELPCNTQGEIITRSPFIMAGYYKMPVETAKAVDAAGWLHTGDLGMVDEDGYFRITGRIKEMIIRGGENIYPREIEEFLFENPSIETVQVVGIPDEKYGEQVLAVIKLKNGRETTVEELVAFCAGRIARHKIPKYFQFVDEFPMTASGKIQKFKLAQMFAHVGGQPPSERPSGGCHGWESL